MNVSEEEAFIQLDGVINTGLVGIWADLTIEQVI